MVVMFKLVDRGVVCLYLTIHFLLLLIVFRLVVLICEDYLNEKNMQES